MEQIKELVKKICTKEIILYAVFGVLTTIINLVTFYILTNIFHLEKNISNIIAIVIAVILAYLTNKDLVFHSKAKTLKEKGMQFAKFISGRAFTMVVEWVGCAILFLTPIPTMVSKLAVTIIVIILNFFISKFLVFKK